MKCELIAQKHAKANLEQFLKILIKASPITFSPLSPIRHFSIVY